MSSLAGPLMAGNFWRRRADNLLMVAVADQNNGAPLARKLKRFQENLGDQRAGGIDHFQRAILGFLANGGGNPVSAEDEHAAVRNVLDGFDEDRAAPA